MSHPDLPPLLASNRHAWPDLLSRWILGSAPSAPTRIDVDITELADVGDVRSHQTTVRWDRGSIDCTLLIPPGDGMLPVFITQETHPEWAIRAVRRGYIGCIIPTCDEHDQAASFDTAYPDADWGLIRRRAWAASRVVDGLLTHDRVDRDRIAIVGHSRNGKQALMAAAYDERIAAAIGSSPGAGGSIPFRLGGPRAYGEGAERLAARFPDWFPPRITEFSGKEEIVPVDMHHLIAMIAPRSVLLTCGLHDPCDVPWAVHVTERTLRPWFAACGDSSALAVHWRAHTHEVESDTLESYIDWFDERFGRGDHPNWPSSPYGEVDPLPAHWFDREPDSIDGALGERRPHVPSGSSTYGVEPRWYAAAMARDHVPEGVARDDIVLEGGIAATIWRPIGDGPFPILILSGAWPSVHGYRPAYWRGELPHLAFAHAGYAVVCWDWIGCGRRTSELARYHHRYPHESLLSAMADEIVAAIDAACGQPYAMDASVSVVGYATGSVAAAVAMYRDSRIQSGVIVSPPAMSVTDPYRRVARESLPSMFAFTPFSLGALIESLGERATVCGPGRNDDFGPEMQAVALEWLEQRSSAASG